jgi:hypothetical protein
MKNAEQAATNGTRNLMDFVGQFFLTHPAPSFKLQIRWCPDLAGARLCRRPAAAIATLLRLALRAQPRSEASQIRTLPQIRGASRL